VILVTGGTGFIGEQLVRSLLAREETVRLLVRRREKAASVYGPLLERLDLAEGDLLDPASLDRAAAGVQRVYHLASWICFRADYPAAHRVNVEGTRNLMEACRRAGVRRVVHVSSVAAGGPAVTGPDGRMRPRTEADPPQPLPDAYGRTKREQEEVVLSYCSAGMEVVVVRPSAVFGPGDPEGLNTLLRMVQQRKLPFFLGSEQIPVNLVFVRDVVRGMLAAMEKGRSGEIYNLVGPNLTQGELLRLAAEVGRGRAPGFAMPIPVLLGAAALVNGLSRLLLRRPGPVHPHEIRNWTSPWLVSGEKTRTELGIEPTPMREALQETYAWLEEHRKR